MIDIGAFYKKVTQHGVIRNISVLSICNGVGLLIGMIINIRLARVMSPASFGQYGVLSAIVVTFLVIASLGLQNVVIRSIARNRTYSKDFFFSSFILKSIGFFCATAFLVIYQLFIVSSPPEYFTILLLILSLLSFCIIDEFQNIALGMEQMDFTGYINVLTSFLLLIVFWLLPEQSFTVRNVFAIYIVSQFFKAILLYIALIKKKLFTGNIRQEPRRDHLKSLFLQGIPFYILALCSMISNQFPVLFLDVNAGEEQVAFYNTANKLLQPMTLVIATTMSVLFPHLSKLFTEDKKKYQTQVKSIFSLITIAGIVLAFAVALFRNEVVFLIYGEEYRQTGYVMAYQCWYLVFFALFCFIGTILGSSDKQKLLSILSVFYALVSTPIIWIGSKYGAEALSVSFIIASIINMIYHWIVLQKNLPEPLSFKFSLGIFSFLLVSFSLSLLIPPDLNLFVKLIIIFACVSAFVLFECRKRKQTGIK